MKKNLHAFLAIILCIPTFLFAQIPPACEPPGEIVPGENCQSACISCNFSSYTGTTAGWAGDGQPPGWCSNIQNDQWIGFVASTTGAIFTITPSDCVQGQGVQAAIFPAGCNDSPLLCNPGCATCGSTVIELSVFGMIPGATYYLLIDGYSQDQCNIDVTVSPAQNGLPIAPTPQITGSNLVCYGGTGTYAVNPVAGAGFYTWTSSHPGTLFNGLPGPVILSAPNGNSVDITFPVNVAPGQNITICVTPSTSCATGTERCKVITVGGATPPPLIFPPVYVCAEDAPYTLPWGEVVNTDGLYTQSYATASGCDSIVVQEVTIGYPITTNLTNIICQGDSVEICGSSYTVSGSYNNICTSFHGCDSLVNLNLLVLSPIADIIDPDTLLSCNLQQLVLHAAPSPGIKIWKDLTTGFTTYADSIIVDHAGFYSLQTLQVVGFNFCEANDTIYVGLDSLNAAPGAAATVSGPITCIAPAILSGSSVFSLTAASWTGPQGFTADTNVVSVTVPGIYTFTAVGAFCTNSVNVTVTGDLNPGNLSLTITQATCSAPGVISVISSLPVTYEWTSPTGEIFNTPSITTSLTGTYNLVTTNPTNGCTNTFPVELTADFAVPILLFSVTHATAGQNDGAIDLTPQGGAPPFTYEWMFGGVVFAQTEDISNLAPGIYSVTVTGSNGCTQSVTIEVNGAVAVQDLNNAAQWIVSPNPASTTVQLQWKGNAVAPESAVSCYDAAGRLMFKKRVAEGQTILAIDCSLFPNGSYLLEIAPVGQGQKTVLRFEMVK